MPYEIKLDQTPGGYAMDDATGVEGSSIRVVVQEFTSSDDGEEFITRLEGLPSIILRKLPTKVTLPEVVNLLVILRRDLTATVYLNELEIIAKIQGTRVIAAGEPLVEDDIADITEIGFKGVEIPNDSAIIFLFSVGWRKGFFFDLMPLNPEFAGRDYDLPKTLGAVYAFVSNSSIFRLTDSQWDILIRGGWFPFISLPRSLLKTLVGRARGSGVLDIMTPLISGAVRVRLPRMLDRWSKRSEFDPHIVLIRKAADRFRERDFISAVAVLIPRIEGLLRSTHASLASAEQPNSDRLADFLMRAGADSFHPYSWLLPGRFEQYLKDWYFAGFKPGQAAPMSRHSVGHGVADVTDFDEKRASLSFLILDQIYYLIRRVTDKATQASMTVA